MQTHHELKKVGFKVHSLIQDTDNFNVAILNLAVENEVFANTVFEIALPNVIAIPTLVRFIGKLMKDTVNLGQINIPLLHTPFFLGVMSNIF